MSVNVPTNQKIKEQDVNAKLQLYGIYAGMFAPIARRMLRIHCSAYPPLSSSS